MVAVSDAARDRALVAMISTDGLYVDEATRRTMQDLDVIHYRTTTTRGCCGGKTG